MNWLARLAVIMLFAQATSVWAGIADSPLPELEAGKKTLHLYSVPGIVRNGSYRAYFACTSTDTAPMRVGVEVFAGDGSLQNDVTFDSLTVSAGSTVVLGTGPSDWFTPDKEVASGAAVKFSVRILATSKKLACTAFTTKASNNGGDAAPTSPLTIIARTRQKAAN